MAGTDEELEWIQRSLRGDAHAFEVLVRNNQRMIHALAFRMTGSNGDAEDIAQEVFLQAFRNLDTFRQDARFSTWLCQIAVNRCLNWRRRESRAEALKELWVKHYEFSRNGDAEEAAEVAARVQKALMTLSEAQRAAIILTVYEDMTHAEAARVLRCSETTVSWRVFVARRKLGKLLANHMGQLEPPS